MQINKKAAIQIHAIRGMNDILPSEAPYWELLEQTCRTIAAAYGYQEIRFPVLEQTELFKRTIGQATDIVEKEMYSFEDRNGDNLTLRPEGTAGCVRAVLQNDLLRQGISRLWYMGPMFRHERPQKGRYRLFHQFGIEAFGIPGPALDAEQILLSQQLWEKLGLVGQIKLQINSLGTADSRARYREVLVNYLQQHYQQLDEDSQRRLITNPLRILDSKNPSMQTLIAEAPQLMDYLNDEAKAHFQELLSILDQAQVDYVINPRLVRGLDYYGYTVYEWVTESLGSQGTVCAGGRYNDLVAQLGGPATPAVGFALGLERLALLLEENRTCSYTPDIYFIALGEAATTAGLLLAERLRRDLPGLRIEMNLTETGFKNQFKKADRSGAHWALIVAENEVQSGTISCKNLRKDEPQQQLTYDELFTFLKNRREL